MSELCSIYNDMTNITVGSKVRIRTDLSEHKAYDEVGVVSNMVYHRGKTAIITSIRPRGPSELRNGYIYEINLDKGIYIWSKEMFTKIRSD